MKAPITVFTPSIALSPSTSHLPGYHTPGVTPGTVPLPGQLAESSGQCQLDRLIHLAHRYYLLTRSVTHGSLSV